MVIRGSGRGGAVTVEQVLLSLLLSWTHYTRKAAKVLSRSEVPAHGCAWFILPHCDGSPSTPWLSFLDVHLSKSIVADLYDDKIFAKSFVNIDGPDEEAYIGSENPHQASRRQRTQEDVCFHRPLKEL
ncbi:hypothetical protein CF326_g3119 [Tilletia indica]|nr:hypothetical protein CF326_g3119 [Tilletia indica]